MHLTERRGISGIIAGVILFALLFSVGTSFFLLELNNNTTYDTALVGRQQTQQQNAQESLALTVGDIGGYLTIDAFNQGSVIANVTAVIVYTPGSGVSEYGASFSSNTTPSLPVIIAPQLTVTLTTPIVISSSDTYYVYVLTETGVSFTGVYPPAASDLVPAALTSGAIGDLYLTFYTFTYYKVVSCTTSTSGYCLGTSGSGFVTPAGAGNIAFAVTMTDLNSQHESIVLDQFTLIYQNAFYGNAHQNFIPWYIVTNSSNNIDASYTPIVLAYNTPTTVVFASGQCISASSGPDLCSGNAFAAESTPSAADTISANFIISHGWEVTPPVSLSALTYSNSNYGQDSPFVSTLFT